LQKAIFPDIQQINKFGANMSSTAGTKLEIWDGGAVYRIQQQH